MSPDSVALDPKQRRYHAFISYSHKADTALAEALKTHLEKFAKPWYRPRAANIFRDTTSLAASPHLWATIVKHLEESDYLIVLASPTAAESRYVRQEICHWITDGACERPEELNRSQIVAEKVNHLLLVLTEGEIPWDHSTGDFDWEKTSALPKGLLSKVFAGEPLWVDARWARAEGHGPLDRTNNKFLEMIAKLSAPLRGVEIEKFRSLIDEDHRQHRRTLSLFRWLSLGLAACVIVAGLAGYLYWRQADVAKAQQNLASLRAYNSRLVEAELSWRENAGRAREKLAECPRDRHDFCWYYLHRMADRTRQKVCDGGPDAAEILAVAPGASLRFSWVDNLRLFEYTHESRTRQEYPQLDGQPSFLAYSSDATELELVWWVSGKLPQILNLERRSIRDATSDMAAANAKAMVFSPARRELFWTDGTDVMRVSVDDATDRSASVPLGNDAKSLGSIVKLVVSTEGKSLGIAWLKGGDSNFQRLFSEKSTAPSTSASGTLLCINEQGSAFVAEPFGKVSSFDRFENDWYRLQSYSLPGVPYHKCGSFDRLGSSVALCTSLLDSPHSLRLIDIQSGNLLARIDGTQEDDRLEHLEIAKFVGERGAILTVSEQKTRSGDPLGQRRMDLWDPVVDGEPLPSPPKRATNSDVDVVTDTINDGRRNLTNPQITLTEHSIQLSSHSSNAIQAPHNVTLKSAAASSDGKWVACSCVAKDSVADLIYVRPVNGSQRWTRLENGDVKTTKALAFSGDRLAIGGSNIPNAQSVGSPGQNARLTAAVDIYRLDDLSARPVVIQAESTIVNALSFSSDGRTLAGACGGLGYGASDRVLGFAGEVRLWDPVTGQQRLVLRGFRGQATEVAFFFDEATHEQLVACSDSGGTPEVLLWNPQPWEAKISGVEKSSRTPNR